MFYGNILNEGYGIFTAFETRIGINGKRYKFYTHISEKIAKEKNMKKLKEDIITRAKQILSHEESIKKQVYSLYKNTTNEDFDKDKIEKLENIDPAHEEFKEDGFELGIFFTNINQFYTIVDKKFKIYKDETYVY